LGIERIAKLLAIGDMVKNSPQVRLCFIVGASRAQTTKPQRPTTKSYRRGDIKGGTQHMAFRTVKTKDGRDIEVPKKYTELTKAEKAGAKWGSMMTRNQVKEKIGLSKPRD